MVQFIAAISLIVPDYDAAIQFYVEKLDFSLLEDTELGEGKRWVRVAPMNSQTSLLLAKGVGARQIQAIGNQTGGRVGFFLQTDNFDRDFALYSQRGVSFLQAPRDEIYGKVVVFADPFGNKWDLIEMKNS